MCHGHPHFHPCSHTSVKWLYCPEAKYDMTTGYEAPCGNPIYSTMQTTNVNCPLQNCNFKKLKGNWNCCVCNKGPNTQGWCTVPRSVQDWNPITRRYEVMETACGHGCCSNCTLARKSPRSNSPALYKLTTTKPPRESLVQRCHSTKVEITSPVVSRTVAQGAADISEAPHTTIQEVFRRWRKRRTQKRPLPLPLPLPRRHPRGLGGLANQDTTQAPTIHPKEQRLLVVKDRRTRAASITEENGSALVDIYICKHLDES